MGKQILLYMLADDHRSFCRYVKDECGMHFVERDGESPTVTSISCDSYRSGETLCIWDQQLCPDLNRKWIPDPGYYRLDTLRLPLMEYQISVPAEWEGAQALCQGRIFGNFEPNWKKPEQFLKSFDKLTRWVKGNYQKAPKELGGYVGPSAWAFFNEGAYLLPAFVPPETNEWKKLLNTQHSK